MSYRKVPRQAIRYTQATRPQESDPKPPAASDLSQQTYRDIQARAVVLGINGKQTREALIAAIEEAENA